MEMQSKKARKRWTNHVSGDVEKDSEKKKTTEDGADVGGNSSRDDGIVQGYLKVVEISWFTQIHRYDVGNIYGGGFPG